MKTTSKYSIRFNLKVFVLIFYLVLNIGCNSNINFKTPQIKKYFSFSERKELARIVAYVDSIVLSQNKYTDINKAFHYYLDSINDRAFKIQNNLEPVTSHEKRMEFISNIDTVVFKKIWIREYVISETEISSHKNSEDNFNINLNSDGEYIQLLKELGENNDFYETLVESIKGIGGLAPSQKSTFLFHNRKFDFNNLNNRLWAVVFLLTIE